MNYIISHARWYFRDDDLTTNYYKIFLLTWKLENSIWQCEQLINSLWCDESSSFRAIANGGTETETNYHEAIFIYNSKS